MRGLGVFVIYPSVTVLFFFGEQAVYFNLSCVAGFGFSFMVGLAVRQEIGVGRVSLSTVFF